MTRAIRKTFNMWAAELSAKLKITIQLDEIIGYNPVQAYGRVDGFPFYFHARGDTWIFRIHRDTNGDPRLVNEPKDGSRYSQQYSEDDYAAGQLTNEQVYSLLEDGLTMYKKRGFPSKM
jgi:hypothetical protein